MSQITSTTKTTTCFLFFLVSFYLFQSLVETKSSYLSYYASMIQLIILLVVALLVVLAIRTTIVTWITVMVLLAFAGKRRRVLVKEGRQITSDVAMYLVQVVLKEKSLVAIACATIVCLMAVTLLRVSDLG